MQNPYILKVDGGFMRKFFFVLTFVVFVLAHLYVYSFSIMELNSIFKIDDLGQVLVGL